MPRKAPLPQIGVRMEPSLRDEIRVEADKYFGGNESLLLREGAILYINLRRKLGTLYEPTLGLWLGPDNTPPDNDAPSEWVPPLKI